MEPDFFQQRTAMGQEAKDNSKKWQILIGH